MKASKMSVLKVAVTLLVGLAVIYGLCALCFPFLVGDFLSTEFKKAQQRQERLLCETSFQAVLDACRVISRQVTGGELKPGEYQVRIDRSPDASRFPQVILDLDPSYVYIDDDGRVMVELVGGIDHFGVYAYPEDYRAPSPSFIYGDKKLIDGLWYYNEDYKGNPALQKKIEALIEKGKARQR